MAETLGSLCDKLTIVKLKQWHSEDRVKLQSLAVQAQQLQEEIEELVKAAVMGLIPTDRLTFAANKVYRTESNSVPTVAGGIGAVISHLATVNADLWHEQEKVYDFERVPAEGKDQVVKKLALLNLERNECIDRIDQLFSGAVKCRGPVSNLG